jgi:hypothetical protein
VKSYARPGKLFTANQQLILSQAGQLTATSVHAGFGCCSDIAPSVVALVGKKAGASDLRRFLRMSAASLTG